MMTDSMMARYDLNLVRAGPWQCLCRPESKHFGAVEFVLIFNIVGM